MLAMAMILTALTIDPLPSQPNADSRAASVATQCGIVPQALAISAVTGAQAQDALNVLSNQHEILNDVPATRRTLSNKGKAERDLRQRLTRDPKNTQILQQWHQARLAVAAAAESHRNARDAVANVMIACLTPEQSSKLQVVRTNLGRRVPDTFLTLSMNSSDWCLVEQSLIARHRAERMHVTLSPIHSQRLAAVESQPQIAQAQQDLATNLSGCMSAFGQ